VSVSLSGVSLPAALPAATHLTPGVRRGSSACAPFWSLAPCPRAAAPRRCRARGWLQTIQGSSDKPSKEAVVCRRCLRERFCANLRASKKSHMPAHTSGPLHEPPDNGWIREHKLRRIVSKLKEKFPSPHAAIKKLDRDGGGDLDRSRLYFIYPRPVLVSPPGIPPPSKSRNDLILQHLNLSGRR
jgi:hypothetical protein